MLTRLVNAYTDSDVALAPEDAYWLDTSLIYESGLFAYVPWPSDLANRGQ
jgi:hypothetical protein